MKKTVCLFLVFIISTLSVACTSGNNNIDNQSSSDEYNETSVPSNTETEQQIKITQEDYLQRFINEEKLVSYDVNFSNSNISDGKTISLYEVKSVGDGCVLSIYVPLGKEYISDILLTIDESNNLVSMAEYHVGCAIAALGLPSLDSVVICNSLGVISDLENRESMNIYKEDGIDFVFSSSGTRRNFSITLN